MRLRRGIVLVALFSFLGACGDDNEAADNAPAAADPGVAQDTAKQDAAPSTGKASRYSDDPIRGLTVTEREVYQEARIVCGLKSPRAVAADFGLNTSDPVTIAQRYARGYEASVKQAAYEGCFTGLSK